MMEYMEGFKDGEIIGNLNLVNKLLKMSQHQDCINNKVQIFVNSFASDVKKRFIKHQLIEILDSRDIVEYKDISGDKVLMREMNWICQYHNSSIERMANSFGFKYKTTNKTFAKLK